MSHGFNAVTFEGHAQVLRTRWNGARSSSAPPNSRQLATKRRNDEQHRCYETDGLNFSDKAGIGGQLQSRDVDLGAMPCLTDLAITPPLSSPELRSDGWQYG